MATLLARVTRVNARMGYRRSAHGPHSVLPSQGAAIGQLKWREGSVLMDSKSFSTCSHVQSVANNLTCSTTEVIAIDKRRHANHGAADKKTQWIEELVGRNAFDMMLRVVQECYQPLYESRRALHGVECSLSESYEDRSAVAKEKSRYVVKWYNDQATRSVEVKTMELFLAKNRPDLAIAMYNHRKFIAKKLDIIKDKKSGYVTDFNKHYKGFWLAAMAAFRKVGENEETVAVYVRSVQTGAEPSAAMTSACLKALLAIEDDEAVRSLYDVVKESGRPVDYQFCTQMMQFAGLVEDSELTHEILRLMEAEKVVLRAEDYLTAIRSLDGLYFQAKTSEVKSVAESYHDCLDRVASQNASPEAHARVLKACQRIVSTFDEMVHVAKIVPSQKAFFPRIMRAAMLLEDYERVTEYAEMYETVFGTPITGNKSLVMATNALLLQHEPVDAWDFVIRAYEFEKQAAKRTIEASSGVWTALTSILQYLGARQDHALTCQFLDALKAKMLLFIFRRDQRRSLIEAVVADTDHVSDSTLLEMIRQYGAAFSVRTKALSLKDFADACVKSNRWSLLLQVLKSRDVKQLRWIPWWLAVPISEAAVADVLSIERMELTAELARIVDLSELDESERATLSRNASVAVQSLYAFHDGAGVRMSQFYEREISRLQERLPLNQPASVEGETENGEEVSTEGERRHSL